MIQRLALLLAQRLLMLAIDRSLQRALPTIFYHLDRVVPYWLDRGASPTQVNEVITGAMAKTLNRQPTEPEQLLVRLLFDPVIAARSNLRPRAVP